MKPVKLRIVREIHSHEAKRKVSGVWTIYELSDGRWFFPNHGEISGQIHRFGKYPVDITLFPEDETDLIDELKDFSGNSYVFNEKLEVLLVENLVRFKLEEVNMKDTYCVVNNGVVVYQGTDKKQFIAEIFFSKVQESLKNFTDKQQFMAEIKQAVAEIDG